MYFISIKFKAKDVSGQAAASAEASNVLAPTPLGFWFPVPGMLLVHLLGATLNHPEPPSLLQIAPLCSSLGDVEISITQAK